MPASISSKGIVYSPTTKWVLRNVTKGSFQKCAYDVPTTLKCSDMKNPVSCLLTGLYVSSRLLTKKDIAFRRCLWVPGRTRRLFCQNFKKFQNVSNC